MRALLLAASALACAAAAAAATAPRVALDGLAPLTVVGSGFEHRAPVRVTVTAGDLRLVRVVRTTRTGTFTAAWQTALRATRCAPVTVVAATAHRRATAKAVVSGKDCGPRPRETP